MPEPKRHDEAREWLRFAQEDLDTAETLLAGASPKIRPALFHAQQAAEKALKGFLVWHDCEYPFTHNLTLLLDRAAALDSSLRPAVIPAVDLTQFAVRLRYPGDQEQPELAEARSWLSVARSVCEAIASRLL